jgi:carbon storage regulator CsrA
MLILMRRKGEEIVIGDDIRITVLRALRDRVFLGITAPPGVRVDRGESPRWSQVGGAVPTMIESTGMCGGSKQLDKQRGDIISVHVATGSSQV